MAIKTFLFETFVLHPKDVFHLARTTIDQREDLLLHNHNYAEFFVVSEGTGVHLINGEKQQIQKGSFCFIRPEDTHTFQRTSKEGLVITNLAIKSVYLIHYIERYFDNGKTFYWLQDSLFPFQGVFKEQQLKDVLHRIDIMMDKPNTFLTLDLFLIHLFDLLNIPSSLPQKIPSWLTFALEQFRSPYHLKKGQESFIRLSQRSGDHINRVLKSTLNKTLTELINEERLNYAAKQLAMTNATIKGIYTDAGFENHSYFFRVFKRQFGITPLKYRNKNHKIF
ncbi:helix-turn-helix domain-containing protein [Flammeovirga kamogawensis]|uniref:AraC family transcriptional regulator n=1 Tax=Flammeovirga kamogawensis TaxID=373891 RepID=A0ABX8H3L4_9BACT|nr:helix-turn-helix domain-containing protein [Flammeovirga kamogawensis]MBB6461911.1 AraC family cel operon transcriptional repressor [Flammeovirga kamogawensis]QWG10480.1 AraC family transcriptional regulator [Flammeovirga kamogawensis]TRX63591.1 helix-turn-helix domain-containing protein [Flammeovirga kamogawensis]